MIQKILLELRVGDGEYQRIYGQNIWGVSPGSYLYDDSVPTGEKNCQTATALKKQTQDLSFVL